MGRRGARVTPRAGVRTSPLGVIPPYFKLNEILNAGITFIRSITVARYLPVDRLDVSTCSCQVFPLKLNTGKPPEFPLTITVFGIGAMPGTTWTIINSGLI